MATARSSSVPVRAREFLTKRKEQTYVDAFYSTSNGDYSGFWHDGTRGAPLSKDVPPMREVLNARKSIKKPPRPLATTAKCMLANAMDEEKKANQVEKIASADVIPRKFPVRAKDFHYPEQIKRGANNPLYQTSSMAIGKAMPTDEHLPDRYFPTTKHFTRTFVDAKPRNTSLNTVPSYSRTHKTFDEYY